MTKTYTEHLRAHLLETGKLSYQLRAWVHTASVWGMMLQSEWLTELRDAIAAIEVHTDFHPLYDGATMGPPERVPTDVVIDAVCGPDLAPYVKGGR